MPPYFAQSGKQLTAEREKNIPRPALLLVFALGGIRRSLVRGRSLLGLGLTVAEQFGGVDSGTRGVGDGGLLDDTGESLAATHVREDGAEQFIQQIQQAGQLGAVFADVRRGKALATVVDQVTVTDTSGAAVDTKELFGSPESDEAEAADES